MSGFPHGSLQSRMRIYCSGWEEQVLTEFRTYGAAAELLDAYREQPRLGVHRRHAAWG
jgi:hypothetical protein